MFSKSIILLLCVVSFTVKSITAGSGEIVEAATSERIVDDGSTSTGIVDDGSTSTGHRIKTIQFTASNGEIPAGTVETASSGDIPAGTVETASSGEIPAEKEETATSERIVDDGSTSTGNKKLKDMTDEQWANLFKQYDTDEDGIISPKEFQNLVFNEFSGFLTVHDADIYKTLISKDKSKTELEMFKNMKPIIYLLTKRTSKVEIGNVSKNDTYSKESFVEVIKENEQARKLFSDENEISEILNLISQKVKWPINWTKLEEILKMVADSLMMVEYYEGFCSIDKDQDGRIAVKDMVKALIDDDSDGSANEKLVNKESANEELAHEEVDNEESADEKLAYEESVNEESGNEEVDNKESTDEELAYEESSIIETFTKIIKNGDLDRNGFIDFYEYLILMSNEYNLDGDLEMSLDNITLLSIQENL